MAEFIDPALVPKVTLKSSFLRLRLQECDGDLLKKQYFHENIKKERRKMAEFIDPALVPKVTLPSGEQVPCVGMGTFGSDGEKKNGRIY